MTLAIAVYAHHTDVKAYRLIASTTKRIARFSAPNTTIIWISENKSEPQVAITYKTATAMLFVA